MKKIFLLAAAVVAFVPSWLAAADKTKGELKVISYNIRYMEANDGTNSWQYRYPASAMMIMDQKPDIFGLQEAKFAQKNYLADVCKGYKGVGVGRDDGKKEGEIMAIFYNTKTVKLLKWGTYWLSETPDKPSMGWDAACYRTATWALLKDKKSGKKYFLVNTHLDNSGARAREKGLSLVLERIAAMNPDGFPLLLMGDFNMTLDDPSMAPAKNNLQNCRQIAVKSDDLDTCHDWGRHLSSIDFIWEKGFSSCIEYQTLTKEYGGRAYISDHYPIFAKLMF